MAAAWLASGGKLPFGVKPPTPTINRAHPLAQGLVFDANYFAPGGGGNNERAGITPLSTYTGTTASIGPHGVARTFAAGTNADTYVSDAAVNGLTQFTVELLFKRNGASGSGLGRIIRKGAANQRFNAFMEDASSSLRFVIPWSGNDGDWETPGSSIPTGVWLHTVIAYSFSSTANDPTIWINGAPQTLTENFSPAGTAPTDTTSLIIGNREDGARGFNGDISHVRLWNRMLGQGEVAQLYADPFALYVQSRRPTLTAVPASAVTGNLAATETQDTAALSGNISSGSLAATEAQDAAALTGNVASVGTLAANEAPDVAAISGTVGSDVTGSLGATETADAFAASGNVASVGTLAANDNPDSASITGAVSSVGTLAGTEAPDTAAITGSLAVFGTLAAVEATDTAAIIGSSPVVGSLAGSEANDNAAITGEVVTLGGTYPEAIEGDPSTVKGRLAGGGSVVAGSITSTGRVVAGYLRGRP